MSISSTHWNHSYRTWGHIMALLMWPRPRLEFQNTRCPVESLHLLADLASDIWLQPACEDLVYDAIAVVGVVGLLPIIIAWGKDRSSVIHIFTTYTPPLKVSKFLRATDPKGWGHSLTEAWWSQRGQYSQKGTWRHVSFKRQTWWGKWRRPTQFVLLSIFFFTP